MSKFGYVVAGLVGAGLAVGGAYAYDTFKKKSDDMCDCLEDCADDAEDAAEDAVDAE